MGSARLVTNPCPSIRDGILATQFLDAQRQKMPQFIESYGISKRVENVVTIYHSFSAPSSLIDTTASSKAAEQPLSGVLRHLNEVVEDEDQYAGDEEKPTAELLHIVRKTLSAVSELQARKSFPKTYVSVYYGDLDLTWKNDTHLIRLTFRRDGTAELYRQENYRESPRGQSQTIDPVMDAGLVSEFLGWLNH